MNGFVLKLIAMLTMLLDHSAAIFLEYGSSEFIICRTIGRVSFPIFCFLLVEGFLHTHNVRKYLLRLGVFALLSEIPFDLAFYNQFPNFYHQNIYFTLFIGLLVIYLIHLIDNKMKNRMFLCSLSEVVVVAVGCIAALLLAVDYNFAGVLLIVGLYIFRRSKVLQALIMIFMNVILIGDLQSYAILAMIFIWFYNGERGPKINKYVFYAFYPIHLLILYFIRVVIV
ncbi:TraX family protein [Anaerocolumna cellulosilytica]|uniref:TraX family protein n=1 Tax=Anaerocolumna cellulosilytica TaxID=433286 RepID=UPI0018490D38|nr:TraX family protein [Anaerocolumna cellulosilytica]MBB5196839.1 hypothetical protein [Anaerocolumna cellulosilytica]